jgi:4-hydroxy-2-oxoheptanedioate aldolase
MTAKFKQKLARGDSVIVLNADHPAPSLVESIGRLPVDAVFIDCEQGSANVESVENMARAARLVGLVSLVRLFDHSDWVIERYMGRGVDGIVIPRLRDPAEAAAVVDAIGYCFPQTYQEKVIVIQIETSQALQALDEFVAMPDVDVLFLGPVDLAKSLGYHGNYRHPIVQKELEGAVKRIVAGGKTAGILVDPDNVAHWVGLGVRFLYEHANSMLALGAVEFANRAALAQSGKIRSQAISG